MIFPTIITDSLLIIPVYSHGHAKSLITQHTKVTILYYILPQDSVDSRSNIIIEKEIKNYSLYLYTKSMPMGDDNSIFSFAEQRKISYSSERQLFLYQGHFFENLGNLFKYLNIEVLSKQEAAMYFLNNTYLALADSQTISNQRKWICGVPRNIAVWLDDPDPPPEEVQQVYFCYNSQVDRRMVISYLQRLEKIISTVKQDFELSYTEGNYLIIGESASTICRYIALTPNALSSILEYQSLTAIPSLEELTFRQLAKIPEVLIQKQPNQKIFGLVHAENIVTYLKHNAKVEGRAINKSEIEKAVEKSFDLPLFKDPRFLFFSYPHLKELAIKNTTKTVTYLLDKEKSRVSCSIQ